MALAHREVRVNRQQCPAECGEGFAHFRALQNAHLLNLSPQDTWTRKSFLLSFLIIYLSSVTALEECGPRKGSSFLSSVGHLLHKTTISNNSSAKNKKKKIKSRKIFKLC